MEATDSERKGADSCILRPDRYCELLVTKIERLNDRTALYTLSAPEGNSRPVCRMGLGQHVYIQADLGQETMCRPFTPISDTNYPTDLLLLIKIYRDGKMSKHVSEWCIGKHVRCRGPMGEKVDYACNKYDTVLLLASGTGITPMINIIDKVLTNEDDDTRVILLFSNRTYEEIWLKTKLNKWTDHWNFHVIYFVSREAKEALATKAKYQEKVYSGRIIRSSLQDVQTDFNIDLSTTFAYVCGSVDFESNMATLLLACGAKPNNIHCF